MKVYPLVFTFVFSLIPLLSFAEPTKDNIVSITAAPLIDMDQGSSAQNAISSLYDRTLATLDAELAKDPEYKKIVKKLEGLYKKRNKLNEKKENLRTSYLKCWSGCPDVYGSGDPYYCRTQSCAKCGHNCNNRFDKAKADIEENLDKLIEQTGSAEEEEYYMSRSATITANSSYENAIEAMNSFNACINGVIDGEAVYQKRTYASLDECLKEYGWKRPSK